jgi:dephospho-CoA kinase
MKKPTIYLLIGAPASGKSWVASQLSDLYSYISYDENPKSSHLDLLRQEHSKPILYDPTFKISTVIRRHSDEFNFVIAAIQESEETLRNRMTLRGGSWTDTVLKRNSEIRKRYEKYGNGGFIGTSSEVLCFLRQRALT